MSVLKILGIIRKEGIATLGYPFKPDVVPEDFRGRPVIDPDICMGCGACAKVCPADAITISDDREKGIRIWRIFYGRCIFCGRCEEVCPLFAIIQGEEFELASKKREQLETIVRMSLAKCDLCGDIMGVTEREVKQAIWILEKSRDIPRSVLELLGDELTCPSCRREKTAMSIVKAIIPARVEIASQKPADMLRKNEEEHKG